jgi:hypothetical protein
MAHPSLTWTRWTARRRSGLQQTHFRTGRRQVHAMGGRPGPSPRRVRVVLLHFRPTQDICPEGASAHPPGSRTETPLSSAKAALESESHVPSQRTGANCSRAIGKVKEGCGSPRARSAPSCNCPSLPPPPLSIPSFHAWTPPLSLAVLSWLASSLELTRRALANSR